MFFYLYDNFLQDRKYHNDLNQIETRLANLGIQGRSEKITILKNIPDATRLAIKRGADTVIAIGNDQTIVKLLPSVVETNTTLGLIPVGPHQTMAHVLGVPIGATACEVVSRRIVRRLDLGLVNSQYFLTSLEAPGTVIAACDGKYNVTSLDQSGRISLMNFQNELSHGRPDDGVLELVISPGHGHLAWRAFHRAQPGSVFTVKSVKFTSAGGPINMLLDGQITIKTPVIVKVAAKKLRVIVGKNRQF